MSSLQQTLGPIPPSLLSIQHLQPQSTTSGCNTHDPAAAAHPELAEKWFALSSTLLDAYRTSRGAPDRPFSKISSPRLQQNKSK